MTNVNNVYKVISVVPGVAYVGAMRQFCDVVDFSSQRFRALRVGEEGRGRIRRFIPITNLSFETMGNIQFHILCIRLRQGRSGWIGEKMPDTSAVSGSLVLLDTAGGYRGDTAIPTIVGSAEIIETGWRAQGAAGRMGRHPEVMIIATGPARVEWHRTGKLYGDPADWVAWTGDGLTWHCVPREKYEMACDLHLVPDAVMRLGQGDGQA